MKPRGYISIEDYELVINELKELRLENNALRNRIASQEQQIFELKNPSAISTFKSEANWFKPPVSPPMKAYKGRSGSVQSRMSFQSRVNRSSNLTSIEAIDREIEKAEELKDKTYEELSNAYNSPIKAQRLKNIIERWEIEISTLQRTKSELIESMKFR